jgi:hypothetical protein
MCRRNSQLNVFCTLSWEFLLHIELRVSSAHWAESFFCTLSWEFLLHIELRVSSAHWAESFFCTLSREFLLHIELRVSSARNNLLLVRSKPNNLNLK